jgi:hypothetical protein
MDKHFFQDLKAKSGSAYGKQHEALSCGSFTPHDFSDFWENMSTLEEALRFRGLDPDSLADRPEELLPEAERQGISLPDIFSGRDFALLEHCLTACDDCLRKLMAAHQRHRALAADCEALENEFPISDEDLRQSLPEAMGGPRPLLYAAAGEIPSPAGLEGQATGLLVCTSRGEKRANPVECTAWVSKELTDNLELELNGCNVDRRGDLETTEALDEYLYRKLKEIFANNYLLQALNLHKRRIVIDLSDEYIIEKADSLALAAVMAAVQAATGSREPVATAYSARLSINGRLLKIGRVAEKLAAARSQGIRRVVLPAANRDDCPQTFLDREDFTVFFCADLAELFAALGIAVTPAGPEPETADTGTPAAENLSGCEAGPAWLSRRLSELGLAREFAGRLPALLTNLCHAHGARSPRGTVLIIGSPPKAERFLPPSGLGLRRPENLAALVAAHENGADTPLTLADGRQLGLLVNRRGSVTALRRVNLNTLDRDDLAPLLPDRYHHFAVLSRLCEALVIYLPGEPEAICLFAEGELFARYFHGRWEKFSCRELEKRLRAAGDRRGIPWTRLEKTGRAALALALDGRTGGFLFPAAGRQHPQSPATSAITAAGLEIDALALDDLDENEILNLVRNGLTLVIDNRGAILDLQNSPPPATTVTKSEKERLTGETTGRNEPQPGDLVLTAGRDGRVRLRDGGGGMTQAAAKQNTLT